MLIGLQPSEYWGLSGYELSFARAAGDARLKAMKKG